MSTPWSCILFDVDGTIVDSAPQVTRAFRVTLTEAGLAVPGDEHLRRYVGPPLWHSFADLGYEGERIATLVASYRTIYDSMFLEPLPFPGMCELLHDLHTRGVPLATATSKQHYMACAQLEHLGVASAFDVIAGASAEPSSTKATVIADALTQLDAQGVDVSRPVLVGDSIWDVEGAHTAGIDVIGVSWGYGTDADLASCVALAHSVEELNALVS